MTLSYTKFMHLAVPDFLTEPWHSEFAQAMESIDAIVYQAIILAQADLWENNHVYEIGDIVINPDSGGLFSCAVAHTSPASGTFTDDLTANPGRWTSLAVVAASQPDAEGGVENTKYMTSLRVKQAIDAQRPLTSIATQLEAEAGGENTKIMTPLRVAQSIAVRTSGVPQGRLSLIHQTPVMNVDVIASALVYYTQYVGQTLPIWNGSRFEQTDFWDPLVAHAGDGLTSPAPIGANKVNDWFIWKDQMDVTISTTSPGVVTFSAPHGMQSSNPFQFKTTGVLPSPLLPDTTYYILLAGATATSFNISDSINGPPINVSGPQSGVHTVHFRRLTHGPDWTNDNARSAALARVKGIWLNADAITNGPAALRGTYIGSTRSDPTGGTFTWKFGSANGTDPHGWHGLWNLYSRRPVFSSARYSKTSWTYQSGVAREIDDTTTNRIYCLQGLPEDGTHALHSQLSTGTLNQANARPLIKVTPNPGGGSFTPNGYRSSAADLTGTRLDTATWTGLPALGWIIFAAAEQCVNTTQATTFFGAFALGQNQALEVTFTA